MEISKIYDLRNSNDFAKSITLVMGCLYTTKAASVSNIIRLVSDHTLVSLKPNHATGILSRFVKQGQATQTKAGKKGAPRTYALSPSGRADFETYCNQELTHAALLKACMDAGLKHSELETPLKQKVTAQKANSQISESWNVVKLAPAEDIRIGEKQMKGAVHQSKITRKSEF